MADPQPVSIASSRSKTLLLLVGACAFVAAGYWLFSLDAEVIEARRTFNSPALVRGLGIASMVFGGLAIFGLVRKLLDPSPGLVLDERGLTDNSTASSVGFIPWSEISGFQVGTTQGQRILYVLVREPERYIASASPFKRALLKVGQKVGPSPFGITSNTLKIGFDELVELANEHLSAHRHEA